MKYENTSPVFRDRTNYIIALSTCSTFLWSLKVELNPVDGSLSQRLYSSKTPGVGHITCPKPANIWLDAMRGVFSVQLFVVI